MPGRKIPLVNNQIYHVINRGISLQPTFISKRTYARAIELLRYYQNVKTPLRYSKFIILSREKRTEILENLKKEKKFWVEIIAYCLMLNHFHLILKQIKDGGISKFVGKFTNSYTRYFNTKNIRVGPLFQGKFKAIRVETDEQLIHLSRYIHLNPYSSYVVKNFEELENYNYSSFTEYIKEAGTGFCQKEIVLDQFRSKEEYQKFVIDQADYQRSLEEIKHLTFEE